ncbi:MAG: DUF2283 domain-containing protein [Nanohaloarchaea archaeon]|nr:DUF2283 domain-containing protein [Candidatus Nanohaloarchaea archaeon]
MILENARKNTHIEYDFQNDILFAKSIDREYDSSLKLGDFILDLDKNKKVIGFEMFDASKKIGLNKIALNNLNEIVINIFISESIIQLFINVKTTYRSSIKEGTINFEKIKPEYLCDSSLTVSATA